MISVPLRTFVHSATKMARDTAYFANGCFWGTEHHFRKHFIQGDGNDPASGVKSITVGYIGGNKENPKYRDVCTGTTMHAEAIKVVFDPEKVAYADLVEFHYRMHDASQVGLLLLNL